MKTIDVSLKELGYTSDYIVNNDDNDDDHDNDRSSVSKLIRPLGQTIDFVIPTHGDIGAPSKRLISILGKRYFAHDYNSTFDIATHHDNSKATLEHKYKCNHQLRTDAMDEFVSTEKNYIRKLRGLVNTVIKPLKLSCAQDKQPLLKQYLCTNIFLNLEQILDLHEHFLKELVSRKDDFATLCSTFMTKMERYRRYLLKVNDAHELHSAEYQKNHQYRSFIIKAITNPVFERLSLKDLLDQPWKRITAYTLLIKDIRNYTSIDHPDFVKLTDAFAQINTIASVRDDVPTILATKSHDLYLSIRKAPCHLIKQNRTLVTHLDAIEINRITGKLSRYVTLFLFCDKIMVTSRSSHAKGVDICGDDRMTTGHSPLAHLVPKKKKGLDFKFCGWVDLQHIDLFHGPSDMPASFVVRASPDFQDSITETGYEKYFQKGARIFAFQSDTSQQTRASFIQQKDSFVDTFYKTRAVKRQYGNQDTTYHRVWNGVNMYSSLYDYGTYTKVDLKNNVAAILLNNTNSEADISSLLHSSRSSPWIVALVRPDSQGLKLSFWTKFALTCIHEITIGANHQKVDFATVFWNNVHKCEQKLRCSRTYRVMNGNLEADESRRPIRSRSRSLSRTSISNSTSISNISKFFTRSRSQPPFSSSTISSAVSSSPDLVLRPSKSTPSNQHPPEVNRRNSWKQRSRSQSISGDPLTPSSEDNLKTPAPQRRKLSFDASFFKIDLKPSSTPPLSTKQRQHSLSKPQQLISSHKNTKKSVAPIDAPSALARQNASPTHTMKLQASNPKDYSPHCFGPPSYPMAIDPQKQRQLTDKLDAMYHDMAGIGISSRKDHQQQQQQKPRYTLDPLLATCTSGANSLSSAFTNSSTLHTSSQRITGFHGGNSNSTSSQSPSFINTLSSCTSQSSLSSLSLEEAEDPCKGYGPSPQIVNGDPLQLPSSHLLQDQMDDEIARKMISSFVSNKKAYTLKPESLSSHYTFSPKNSPYKKQERLSSMPMATLPTPMAPRVMDKETVLDDLSDALNHCSSQVYSGWHLLLDKQRMLGNQVGQIAGLLPSGELTNANILVESYRETMDESAGFFNKINTELEEISNIVKVCRQRHQQHRNSSIDQKTSPSPIDADNANSLLDQKLRDVQMERDYWRHRANELTYQASQFLQ